MIPLGRGKKSMMKECIDAHNSFISLGELPRLCQLTQLLSDDDEARLGIDTLQRKDGAGGRIC